MADKTVKVNLQFGADTSAAESALARLSGSLKNISNMNLSGGSTKGMQKQIMEASEAAMKLRGNLQAAFNPDTKKLNLSKFNEEMKKSGMSLQQYRTKLTAIGPDGRKAFADLTEAIVSSNTPIQRSTQLMDKLWDTMKKTIGWQLSSTMVHGFMGAIQKAYGYAQDLNKSLTDIRIVTGYDADYMAKFADEANRAAKALNTTTNEYAKASLIYFQQGLGAEDVKARTDVTVKMANVTGQTAEEVSQQLTAVWNNYAEGSDNLERYADVMTALGAATASSSDEIAQGMQKFSAVANTVGLSFDYAAAALATVTATTRESAEVVGTAFKTIFERIDSLKLGETLDDGTNLTKYSAALATVGVNIKDANGEMRNMDDILDDIGAKWTTLNKDQQIALASSVAGVRQYNQFMALMNNWDFMQENLGVAGDADGTLGEQAETYAESWEAARKEVKAAAESLYSDLIDDEFFIKIAHMFADLLTGVDKFIDSIGGLKTLLPGIIILIDKLFGERIQSEAIGISKSLMAMTDKGREKLAANDDKMRQEAITQLGQMSPKGATTAEDAARVSTAKEIVELQGQAVKKAVQLNEAERATLDIYVEQVKAQRDKAIEAAKAEDAARKAMQEAYSNEQSGGFDAGYDFIEAFKNDSLEAFKKEQQELYDYIRDLQERPYDSSDQQDQAIENFDQRWETVSTINAGLNTAGNTNLGVQDIQDGGELYTQLYENLQKVIGKYDEYGVKLSEISTLQQETFSSLQGLSGDEYTAKLNEQKNAYDRLCESLGLSKEEMQRYGIVTSEQIADENQLKAALQNLTKVMQTKQNASKQEITTIENALKEMGMEESKVKNLTQKIKALNQAQRDNVKANRDLAKSTRVAEQAIGKMGKATKVLSGFSNAVRGASSLIMALNGVRGAVQNLQNEDMSDLEKIGSVLMASSMVIPGVLGAWNSLGTALGAIRTAYMALMATEEASNALADKNIAVTNMEAAVKMASQAATEKLSAAQLENQLVEAGLCTETEAQAAASALLTAATNAQTAADESGVLAKLNKIAFNKLSAFAAVEEGEATLLQAAAQWALNASMAPLLVITLALVAAFALLAGGAIAIYKILNPGPSKAEQELASIGEELNAVAEQYKEAQAAAEDFKTAVTDYDEGIKNLQLLNKNTTEYKEALEAANAKARELIETYGLFGQFHYENGVIVFDEGVLENKQNELDMKTYDLGQQQASLEYQKASATMTTISEDFRDTKAAEQITYTESGAQKTLAYGTNDRAQQVGEIYNEAIEAYNAGLADGTIGTDVTKEQYLTKAYEEAGYEFSEGIEAIIKDLAQFGNALKGQSEKMDYYSEELLTNMLYEDYGEQILDAATDENGNVDEQKKAAMDAALGKIGDHATVNGQTEQEATNAKLKEIKSAKADVTAGKDLQTALNDLGTGENFANWDDDELAYEYAERVLGLDKSDLSYTSGNGVGTLTDSSGNKVIDEMSDDAMAKAIYQKIAQEEAMKEIRETYGKQNDKGVELLTQINSQGAMVGNADLALALNNTIANGSTEFDFSSIVSDLSEQGLADLKAMDQDSILEAFGLSDATAEDFQALGFDSAQAFVTAFQEGAKGISEEDWKQSVNEKFEAEAESLGVTSEELDGYAKALQEANQEMNLSDISAKAFALDQIKIQKGMEKVTKAYEDNKDVLVANASAQKKATPEYQAALTAMQEAAKEMLGVTEIDREFVEGHIDDLARAAAEGGEALRKVQAEYADYMISKIDTSSLSDQAKTALTGLQTAIDEMPELKVGMTLEESGLNEGFQKALESGAMTVEQMNEILSGMGFEPEITYEDVVVNDEAKQRIISEGGYYLPDGTFQKVSTDQEVESLAGSTVKLPVIDGKNTKFKGTPAPTASSSGKGGGGGGGGGSSYKAKTKASKDNRYHTTDKKKEAIDNKIAQAQQNTELSYGKAKIDNLKEELKLSKEIVDINKKKYDEALKYLSIDKQELLDAAKALGKTVKFDADGTITNATELLGWLNEQEAIWADKDDSDEKSKMEEKLKNLKDGFSDYEDTLSNVNEAQQAIVQSAADMISKYVEIVQAAVEAKEALSDMKLNLIDYQLTRIGENAYRASERISKLGEQFDVYMDNHDAYLEGINEILTRVGVSYEDFLNMTDEQIAALHLSKEEIETVIDFTNKLSDNDKNLMEARANALEEFNSAMEEYQTDVEYLTSSMEHYIDLVSSLSEVNDLLGLDLKEQVNKALIEAKRYTLSINKEQVNRLRKQLSTLEAHYQQAMSLATTAEERIQIELEYKETNRGIEERLQEAESAFYESWNDTLNQAYDAYTDMLDNVVKKSDEAFAGVFKSMDIFDIFYDQEKELDNLYLDPIKAAISLQELQADIQRQMANTDALEGKEKLKRLLGDVIKLEQQEEKITQHDLDMIQAEYDLELAREKLKDAKNAHNSVMLSRGADGNWGYVYTANQDAIDSAEKAFDEKIKHYTELTNGYVADLGDKLVEIRQTTLDKIREIWDDTTLPIEEKTKYAQGVVENAAKLLTANATELQKALDKNAEIMPLLQELFGLTEDELIDTFGETALGRVVAVAHKGNMTIADLVTMMLTGIEDANAAMHESAKSLENDKTQINEAAQIPDPTTEILDGINNLGITVENVSSQFETLGQKINTAFNDSIESLGALENKLATSNLTKILQDSETAITNITRALQAWTDTGSISEIQLLAQSLANATDLYKAGKMGGTEYAKAVSEYTADLRAIGASFDTGGYTGEWGDEGKLAILHEKEIVLNQGDTVNLLKAINLAHQVELSALTAQSLLSNTREFYSAPHTSSNGLQQNVVIEASFPNAVDHAEIEEAFNNLINEASQYANRKY